MAGLHVWLDCEVYAKQREARSRQKVHGPFLGEEGFVEACNVVATFSPARRSGFNRIVCMRVYMPTCYDVDCMR